MAVQTLSVRSDFTSMGVHFIFLGKVHGLYEKSSTQNVEGEPITLKVIDENKVFDTAILGIGLNGKFKKEIKGAEGESEVTFTLNEYLNKSELASLGTAYIQTETLTLKDKPTTVVEEETLTESIPYDTEVIENAELDYGIENVKQEGSEGTKEVTYEVTKVNGEETDRKVISSEVTKEPVKKIVEVGTKPVITTDTQVENKVIPYKTEIVKNPKRFTTDSRTVTEGVDGLKKLTYEVTLTNGTVTERNLVSEETIKEVINEVIEQGSIPVQKGIDYKVIVKKDKTLENYADFNQVTATKEYTDYNELYQNELLALKAEEGFLIDSIRVGNVTKDTNGPFGGLEETSWNNVNGENNTKEYSVRWGDYINNPTYRVDIEVTMIVDPNTLPEEPVEPVEPPVDPEEPEEPIDPPIEPEEPGRNLIVSSDVTADMFIKSRGEYSYSEGYFTTGFIEVKANEVYTISMLLQGGEFSRVAYYDLDKVFIKREMYRNKEINQIKPEQDGFIRWSPDVDNKTGGYGPGYKIEKGDKSTPWIPAPEDLIETTDPIDPEEPVYNVKLTQELTNVLSDYNKDTLNNNVSITYIAEKHYYLGNINIIQVYSTKQVPHVITSSNNNTANTVDLSQYIDDDVLEIIVKAKAYKRNSQIRYDYANEYGEFTVEGVTLNYRNLAEINDDDTIVITADEGLDFKDGVTIHVNYPKELSTIQKSYANYTFYQDNSSYFNEDSTVIRIPVADVWEEEFYEFPPDYIEVRVRATQKRLGGGFVSNYARIYEMTESNLDKLSTVLWSPSLGSTGTAIYERITSIYSMPFKLPEDLVSDDKVDIVRVGNDSAQYPKANYLLDNRYILPLGKIKIPLEYENVYDYKDTEVKLHAPYVVNPISVDPTYAIGETITLNMAIDLYNGNTTLNIHSTKVNGELVKRVNIPIKHDIPIVMSNSSILEGSVGGFIYNRVTTPFIEVVRNVPYANESVFGKESNDFRTLGDITGYIEVKDSQVKTNATTVEQSRIANELASGIFIKEPLPLTPQ